jgi:hypothetical protein
MAILWTLFPECNRLSGNAHDKDERERLQEMKKEEERTRLFGK